MKICIYGAGAIGGYLAVQLQRAGADVSVVARGAHLDAIRERGLTLEIGDERRTARVRATDRAAELGRQDTVIICLKAHSVPAAVPGILPLLGEETSVVTAYNGLPYWYFYRHGGALEDRSLSCVDPSRDQWQRIGPERAIGCVVYPATELTEPGVVCHVYGNRFPLGEPDGSVTPRVQTLAALLEAAGLKAPVLTEIRNEIWLKLWGNLSLNPISALTCATLDVICADTEVRDVARKMMVEAETIATRLGIRFRVDVERRLDGAGAVGAHRTSTLQDLDRGRPLELDGMVTVIQELGRMVEVPTPTMDVVLPLIKLRAKTAGLYSELAPLAPRPPQAELQANLQAAAAR